MQMGKQRGEAEYQQQLANQEQAKADEAAAEAAELERKANDELEVARPTLERARIAVDCLDKASLTELKSMIKPPEGVDVVMKVILIMLTNEKKSLSWDNGKRLMANVGQFKSRLEAYRCACYPQPSTCFASVLSSDPCVVVLGCPVQWGAHSGRHCPPGVGADR